MQVSLRVAQHGCWRKCLLPEGKAVCVGRGGKTFLWSITLNSYFLLGQKGARVFSITLALVAPWVWLLTNFDSKRIPPKRKTTLNTYPASWLTEWVHVSHTGYKHSGTGFAWLNLQTPYRSDLANKRAVTCNIACHPVISICLDTSLDCSCFQFTISEYLSILAQHVERDCLPYRCSVKGTGGLQHVVWTRLQSFFIIIESIDITMLKPYIFWNLVMGLL